jgi:hypothetical protein
VKDETMKPELEPPDQYISLARAAALSGVSSTTLRHQARTGKLQTILFARDRATTRRWLHQYLMEAAERDKGRRLPLPESYVPPE